jgi:Protein of unknown function (DUF4031)
VTVYVDDARIPATVGRIKGRWSHLFADELTELHEFAVAIGLRRDWFQAHDRRWHYDVTDSMRARAIRAGARPVTWREAPAIMRERDGLPPLPAVDQPRAPGCGERVELVQDSLFPELSEGR